MAEKDTIFSSKIKYEGIFSFKDLYKFCHAWLTEETGLELAENEYEEKLSGDSKELKVKWTGEKEVTDYFKFEIKVEFKSNKVKNVEVQKGNSKVKMNEGDVEISVKGDLVKDYEGKFETTAFQKMMRATYEKWIISARVTEYETKLAEKCDEFLAQAKAFLDLESKR